MLKRDRYPAGVPCWVDTAQPDPEAAARFYGDLFGWEFEERMPPDVPGSYLVARVGGRDVAAVGSQFEAGPPVPAWSTYIATDDAQATAAKVGQAGGRVLAEPFDVLDAGRMAVFADPAGAVFSVWQAGTHIGAQAVNEANAWNWSDLNTDDLEGARTFYGSVFGWETSTVDLGGSEGVMVRVPGYSDYLERLDPGIRRRHSDLGAPEGFSDCVGWMMPLRDDEASPHWSVTFLVDDADAVAEKTATLGGTVVTDPFDAGPVRIAVLRDPQGAVFSVNRFDPGQR